MPFGAKMMKQLVDEYGPNAEGQFDAEQFGQKMGEFATGFARSHEEKKARADKRSSSKPRMSREERAEHKNARKNRAVITGKPENVVEMAPGETAAIEIAMNNASEQANPADCKITFANKQAAGKLPLATLSVKCEQEVAAGAAATFSVPLTMGADIAADGKVYDVNLTFRDANGKKFGELIPIKVQACAVQWGAAQPAPEQPAQQPEPQRWNV